MHGSLREWEARGRYLWPEGRRVFGWERGEGPTILAIHGFPASSYDWRAVADLLGDYRFVAFDLPGFGLSDKSRDDDYSLFSQADIVEAAIAELGIDEYYLLAHDMGSSVAAELLARANEGSLRSEVKATALLNGSVFIDLAVLTPGQKLLLTLPPRPLPFDLPFGPFKRQIRGLFAEQHPMAEQELAMLERLLYHDGGARLLPKTIRYIEERKANAARWTAGLVGSASPLSLLWGEQDPVAVPAIADRLQRERPSTDSRRWDDVGHWPQIEVPERVADELRRIFS